MISMSLFVGCLLLLASSTAVPDGKFNIVLVSRFTTMDRYTNLIKVFVSVYYITLTDLIGIGSRISPSYWRPV